MILKSLAMLLLLGELSCAFAPKSTVTLFSTQNQARRPNSPGVSPENIGIYRIVPPQHTFTELGLISFKTTSFSLPTIYDQLRVDAANQGADCVVGVKIKSETHKESQSIRKCEQKTDCSGEGGCKTHEECHTKWVQVPVTTYTTEGSLARRDK